MKANTDALLKATATGNITKVITEARAAYEVVEHASINAIERAKRKERNLLKAKGKLPMTY